MASFLAATDFFRVFFGMFSPFAIPAAWCYLEQLFKGRISPVAYFLLGLLILLFLAPVSTTYNEGAMFNIDYTKHGLIAGLLLSGEWLRKTGSRQCEVAGL